MQYVILHIRHCKFYFGTKNLYVSTLISSFLRPKFTTVPPPPKKKKRSHIFSQAVKSSFLYRNKVLNDCPLYLARNELVPRLTKNTESALIQFCLKLRDNNECFTKVRIIFQSRSAMCFFLFFVYLT